MIQTTLQTRPCRVCRHEFIALACLLTALFQVHAAATVRLTEGNLEDQAAAATTREQRSRNSRSPAARAPVPAGSALQWRVSPLPADNLIKNPWFRSGRKPSLEHWISDAYWTASNKQGNPTPDEVEGTSARISTGRTDQQRGKTVDAGVETCLYQVIAAEPSRETLKFDMYWVTHTVNPVVVTIYGGLSPEGPWTAVWEPFHQVQTKSVMPKSGSRRGQDLWKDYSDRTEMVTTTLARGYPFYKLEVRATLPDKNGGLKITGVFFTAVASPDRQRRN